MLYTQSLDCENFDYSTKTQQLLRLLTHTQFFIAFQTLLTTSLVSSCGFDTSLYRTKVFDYWRLLTITYDYLRLLTITCDYLHVTALIDGF